MGKVKIKRKSTLIDMTAMSDVTVLLLTFFMLTSTFLQKEPTIVYTPSSISEEKVPFKNLVTILVSSSDKSGRLSDPTITEGKIFLSLSGDSILSTDSLRYKVLDEAVKIYNTAGGGVRNGEIKLDAKQRDAFVKTNMMGTPFKDLPAVLALEPVKRDQLMGDLTTTDPARAQMIGIPIDVPKNDRTTNRQSNLNDFQVWMQAIKSVAQDAKNAKIESDTKAGLLDPAAPDYKEKVRELEMFYNALMQGQAISIKADKDTPFSVINMIFDNLRSVDLNKFTLMTALKSNS